MKKMTKLLALSMTAGLLLVACGDGEDMDTDFPGVEEPADPAIEEDMNEETEEEDMNEEIDE